MKYIITESQLLRLIKEQDSITFLRKGDILGVTGGTKFIIEKINELLIQAKDSNNRQVDMKQTPNTNQFKITVNLGSDNFINKVIKVNNVVRDNILYIMKNDGSLEKASVPS